MGHIIEMVPVENLVFNCPRCMYVVDLGKTRHGINAACRQCRLRFYYDTEHAHFYFLKHEAAERCAYTPLNPSVVDKMYLHDNERPKTTAENIYHNGATRSRDNDRPDYEAMLSPIAMETYAEYMFYCSFLPEGKRREEDNWQRGVPMTRWIKSLFRHVFTLHKIHRAKEKDPAGHIGELFANCGVLFNAFGYLDALMKEHPRLLQLLVEMNKAKLAEQEKYNGPAKQG